MSKRKKLIERFISIPKDFTYDELCKLLENFGYKEENMGNTSGSAVRFINYNTLKIIRIHRPHPGNIVKEYALKQIKQHLKEENYL